MAYTKHDWSAGEIITEANMDHIEQGIKDNNDALNGVVFKKFAVNYGTPYVIGLSNAFRGVLFTMTSNGNTHGLWYVFTTNSGACTATSVISESSTAATAVTGGQNQITLEYPTSGSSACMLICFNGNITS